MDILPSGNIFRELQDIHETGYFSAQPSLEEYWQQVGIFIPFSFFPLLFTCFYKTKFTYFLLCQIFLIFFFF
ncbi:hypothetical protein O3M35_002465 [Rhynocoris fuscipes]|uniref:Uncharacterized protein n=1 Tax=Rhynocoris fuscipes TaxID=488301 RepID=A0AAW1CPG9_9HEMI